MLICNERDIEGQSTTPTSLLERAHQHSTRSHNGHTSATIPALIAPISYLSEAVKTHFQDLRQIGVDFHVDYAGFLSGVVLFDRCSVGIKKMDRNDVRKVIMACMSVACKLQYDLYDDMFLATVSRCNQYNFCVETMWETESRVVLWLFRKNLLFIQPNAYALQASQFEQTGLRFDFKLRW